MLSVEVEVEAVEDQALVQADLEVVQEVGWQPVARAEVEAEEGAALVGRAEGAVLAAGCLGMLQEEEREEWEE